MLTQYAFSILFIDKKKAKFSNDRFGIKQGCANFARLWGPKRFIEILVAEYARLRKFDEQEAIGIAMYSRRKFWTRYRKRHKVKFKLEL